MGINFDTIFHSIGQSFSSIGAPNPTNSKKQAAEAAVTVGLEAGTIATAGALAPADAPVEGAVAGANIAPVVAPSVSEGSAAAGSAAADVGAASPSLAGAGAELAAPSGGAAIEVADETTPTVSPTPNAAPTQAAVQAPPTAMIDDEPGSTGNFGGNQESAYNTNSSGRFGDSSLSGRKILTGVGKVAGSASQTYGKIEAGDAAQQEAQQNKTIQGLINTPNIAPAPVALQTANISDDNPMFSSIFGEYPRKKTKRNLLPPIIPPTTGQQ